VIYEDRRKVLEGGDLSEQALEMVEAVVRETVQQYVTKETYAEEWDLDNLLTSLQAVYPTTMTVEQLREVVDAYEIEEMAAEEALRVYQEKESTLGSEVMRQLERMVFLSIIDTKWREHLAEMDYLQEGIHLRAYGQRDPLTEYRREAYSMFSELQGSIRDEFVRYIYRVELVRNDEPARPRPQRVSTSNPQAIQGGGRSNQANASDKIGRNAPCPCGSGKKYKKCHGLSA
jgi:preprotein translocase subunit SecA